MENMTDVIQPTQTSVDVKLDYIQRDIRDIKDGLKDNVNRREYNEALTDLRKDIAFLQKIIYGFIALLVVSVMGAVFKLVIK